MADAFVATGLNAVPIVHQHYRKVWDPVQNAHRRMKGEGPRHDPDTRDYRTPEDKGYTLRRRSEVASDEEIVDVVRHRGEVVPRRPGMNRRRSSMNDARRGGYESEGSVPPRSRTRARSAGSRRRSGSSSSTSSSDLGSTTDEEKQCKKSQRKKWITAALASVATIHAASKVYSSIEAHDKRILDVQAGKISPEEAAKKQRSVRWQDAAAIGIAALGIKGAISEWNEVKEEHGHLKELQEKKERHHEKRLERMRRERANDFGGYYKGRDGNWYYDGVEPQTSEKSSSRQLDGPRNGDRKMIEGGSGSRPRGRSGTWDDRDARRDEGYESARPRRGSRYDRDNGY